MHSQHGKNRLQCSKSLYCNLRNDEWEEIRFKVSLRRKKQDNRYKKEQRQNNKKKVILAMQLVLLIILVVAICFLTGKTKSERISKIQSNNLCPVAETEEELKTRTERYSEKLRKQGDPDTKYTVQILEDFDAEKSHQINRSTLVKIDMGGHTGSGIVIEMTENQIVIASCGHLLQYADNGVVSFANGGMALGEVIGISETFDVGFMTCDSSVLSEEECSKIHQVNYDLSQFATLKEGDMVIQIGSKNGVASECYEGTISSLSWYFEEFDSEMIYTFCKSMPGMSGGGLFTLNGYFIGMICGSYLEESCCLALPDLLSEKESIVQ